MKTTQEIYAAAVNIVKESMVICFNKANDNDMTSDEAKMVDRAFNAIAWCDENGFEKSIRYAANSYMNSYCKGLSEHQRMSGVINYLFC